MIHSATLTGVTLSRGYRQLFHNLDLRIHAGELLTLTGANGAGKTSLLRILAGMVTPEAGELIFQDGDGNVLDDRDVHGRETHYLGHLEGLKTSRRVHDELAFQCNWLGQTLDGYEEAIRIFGLRPLLDLEVRKLSAGQRRRLAMGRLIGSPRSLWLLDEPMAPLDSRWREAFVVQMQRHLDSGGLIVAAVHDPLPIEGRVLDLGGLR